MTAFGLSTKLCPGQARHGKEDLFVNTLEKWEEVKTNRTFVRQEILGKGVLLPNG